MKKLEKIKLKEVSILDDRDMKLVVGGNYPEDPICALYVNGVITRCFHSPSHESCTDNGIGTCECNTTEVLNYCGTQTY